MTPSIITKRAPQLLALVSVVILVGMGFTVLLSPSEADPSPYRLTLADGEDRIQKVQIPGYVTFEMELQSKFPGKTGHTEIELEVINKTYHSSEKSHWDFTFVGHPDNTYLVVGDDPVTVILRVDFLLTGTEYECEKVTFTIGGTNKTTETKNETHLSPRDGLDSDVEYLTVVTGEGYDPFWEPSTYADRLTHYLPWEPDYFITLWNLGALTTDLWISDWEVWRDVNENGVIDAGDLKNDWYDSSNPPLSANGFFTLTFMTDIPDLYLVGEHIPLASMSSEELKVTVMPTNNRDDVPWGLYLIKIVVDADGDDCEFWDTLKACVCDYQDNPDPCVLIIRINEGWNLISIGVGLDELGNDYTASELAASINDQAGEDIIKYVVMWEGSGLGAGKFTEYVVTSQVGIDFPIEKGEGYYVYSISPWDMEFVIVGDCPKDETFDLIECWNLVGYESMTPTPVGEWATLIEDFLGGQPFIQAIVKYDKDLDDYVAWYPGDPDNLFMVVPGEAYWIFSAADKNWAPFPE